MTILPEKSKACSLPETNLVPCCLLEYMETLRRRGLDADATLLMEITVIEIAQGKD